MSTIASQSFEETTKCPHCGQMTLEPPKLERQRAEAPSADDTEVVDTVGVGFCQAFSALAMKIPPSVCAKVTQKLDRCGIDPAAESDDVKAVLEAAVAAYEKKREAARVSSAKRRASARQKKEAKATATQSVIAAADTSADTPAE